MVGIEIAGIEKAVVGNNIEMVGIKMIGFENAFAATCSQCLPSLNLLRAVFGSLFSVKIISMPTVLYLVRINTLGIKIGIP